MRSRHPPTTLLALLTGVASAAACAGALAATELSRLGPDAQEEIARRCLPLQYREGTAAYHNCVTDEAALRAGLDDSPLDALSFDERYAVYRRCPGATGESPTVRAACIEAELASLDDVPAPYLGTLGRDESGAVRRQCADSQRRDGVAAYRRCLDGALAALEALPTPDLAALALTERNALGLRCAANSSTAADYRRCLLEATGVTVTTADDTSASPLPVAPDDVPEPLATEADTLPAPPLPESADEPVRTDAPSDARARDVTSTDDGDGAAADGTTAITSDPEEDRAPDLGQRVRDARARLETTIAGLDGVERIVLGVALGLPLLLLAGWAATRGLRRRSEPDDRALDTPYRNAELAERVRESRRRRDGHPPLCLDDAPDRSMNRRDREHPLAGVSGDRMPLWGEEEEDELDDTVPNDIEAAAAVPTREAPRSKRSEASVSGGDDPAEDGRGERAPADRDPGVHSPAPPSSERVSTVDAPLELSSIAPRSSFGRWLLAEEEALRRQRAIEFLIYWMAYGDDRYEPATKTALLREDVDDPHDLIKRRVLQRDTHAFGDTVRWLQANTGEPERVQILDLLMALLISENAMTPAQNTLLRFLADAFGIGAETLGERHEIAFGAPLPDLPRVDLPLWWESIESDRLLRWDARALAALDEHRQHRVRLGLPLAGEIGEGEIVESFRRAAGRCHPHRFDALGERERALAERQFGMFEAARDRLLEVTV